MKNKTDSPQWIVVCDSTWPNDVEYVARRYWPKGTYDSGNGPYPYPIEESGASFADETVAKKYVAALNKNPP
jgi:hypothetical protein